MPTRLVRRGKKTNVNKKRDPRDPSTLLRREGLGGAGTNAALTARTQMTQPTSSANGIAWNLQDLYAGLDDPQIARDLESALVRAQKFEADYRGKIETAQDSAAGMLRAALDELESLSEQMDRPAVYASLVHAAKTDDPKHGALLA